MLKRCIYIYINLLPGFPAHDQGALYILIISMPFTTY